MGQEPAFWALQRFSGLAVTCGTLLEMQILGPSSMPLNESETLTSPSRGTVMHAQVWELFTNKIS